MSYPIPFSKRSFFICILFFIQSVVWAQSAIQNEAVQDSCNIAQMKELIASFTSEDLANKAWLRRQKQESVLVQNQKELDGTVTRLNEIGSDGTLLYYTTHMDPTSKVSRANMLHSDEDFELSGQNMMVGIWDAGAARTTHQEFDSRVQNSDGGEVDNHATLVTGTVVSAGIKEKAKGVAYNATALTHDWSLDKIEVAEAALNGLLLSNHSYGIKTDRVPDWYFGSYIKVSQDWDNIMYNAPYYLMVTAAGNAQNSFDNESPNFGKTQDGFDLLVGFTTSKNGLVIAGANADVDRKGNLKNAKVAGYSSYGPIDDGRIKPDLAGDGTLIHSTSSNSNTSYGSSMGTSMAAPGVTGSLLLLQEYYEELYGQFMKSSTLKGLALHTADDVQEPGPDYKMGWGVINVKKAAETLKNKEFSTLILEERLHEGKTLTYTIRANGKGPFSASISWTDPSSTYINRGDLNATQAALTNDLDIRISKDGKTYFPWKLNPAQASNAAITGDNSVDPYERIDILDAEGDYSITISHKGNLTNAMQDVSLLVSGAALTNCIVEVPTDMVITTEETKGTFLKWKALGEETLYELQIKSENETTWTTHILWDAEFSLEDFTIGETYSARLRSVCSQNIVSEFSEEVRFVYNESETILEQNQTHSVEKELRISVFPNPVVNELWVEAEQTEGATYAVASTNGMIIKAGRLEEAISVSDLSTGLYVLTVQDDSGTRSTKFFKD